MTPPEAIAQDVVALLRQDPEGRIIECNETCAHILGYENAAELLESGSIDYVHRSDMVSVAAALRDLGVLSNVEVAVRKKDGSVAWVLQNLREVHRGNDVWIDIAMFDVTEQRVAAQRFEYQAYHDSVTGLPNRMLWVDRARVALAQSKRRRTIVGVVVVDLDNFSKINKRYGQGIGDRVLRGIGERLTGCLREDDAVARLDGDEFMVLLGAMQRGEDAAIAASRIIAAIARPMHIDAETIFLTASVGIALAPQDGTEPESLVRKAAAAAARAHSRGGSAFRFHEVGINARALERVALVERLRHAIERGEIEMHYQPEVNVQTGTIECIEALVRWRHPDLGVITPADFLPAAEQGGLLQRITEIAVERSFAQLRQWHEEGHHRLRMAVNVMPNQLQESSLPTLLAEAAAEFAILPSSIEVEFPEIALRAGKATEVIQALKELDLLLALDDFGTGACSIAELRRLPIDKIKIAPMFIRNMMQDADDAAIVQAMIRMAKGFDLRVVAEGVESKAQLSWLLSSKCNEMQGYFVARPAPAKDLQEILRMQH